MDYLTLLHNNVYDGLLLVSVAVISKTDLGESWLDGNFFIQTQSFILDIQSVCTAFEYTL